MELAITNPVKLDQFVQIFQHLKIFAESINVQCLEDRLFLQGLDAAHVCMFSLSIPGKWFEIYQVQRGLSLGMNTQILSKILGARDKNQTLHWKCELGDESQDKLYISFKVVVAAGGGGEEDMAVVPNSQFDRHFEMPLMEVETETLEIPDVDFAAEFSLLSAKLAAVVQQLKLFGDTMDIACNEKRIQLIADSPGSGRMCVDIKIEEVSSYSIVDGGELCLSYSLNYMSHFCLFQKAAREVSVSISEEYPLQLTYDIGEGATLMFYLAPKMNE